MQKRPFIFKKLLTEYTQENKLMNIERIDLYEYFGLKREGNRSGYLNACLHGISKYYPNRVRPAIIVIAGGGYSGICEREGEPIALAYFAKGYNVFTLDYSCAPSAYPTQLIEGCMAVAFIKDNAERLYVSPEHVAVAGFSAGGHLAAMTATLFDEKVVQELLNGKNLSARPDAVILGYPVISSGKFSHSESIDNLTGGNLSLYDKVSLEKQVKENSSPAFIWGTVNDDLVPSENAFEYAYACKKKGVKFEFHLYEDGRHGLGLANEQTATPEGRVLNSTIEEYIRPDVSTWFEMSVTWLKNRGFKIVDL